MKKNLIKYLPLGILGGILLTILSIAHYGGITSDSCANYHPVYNNIQRVDCYDADYGYPFIFMNSQGHVDVLTLDASKTSPISLGESSVIRYRPMDFVADLAIWTALSLVIISAVKEVPSRKRVK